MFEFNILLLCFFYLIIGIIFAPFTVIIMDKEGILEELDSRVLSFIVCFILSLWWPMTVLSWIAVSIIRKPDLKL